MALKVKAVERLVKFKKDDAGVWRYVMSPEYDNLKQSINEKTTIHARCSIALRERLCRSGSHS